MRRNKNALFPQTKVPKNKNTYTNFAYVSTFLFLFVKTFAPKFAVGAVHHAKRFFATNSRIHCHNHLPHAHRNKKTSKCHTQHFVRRVAGKQCANYRKHHCRQGYPSDGTCLYKFIFEVQHQRHHAHGHKTDQIDALHGTLRNVQKTQKRGKQCSSAHAHAANNPRQEAKQYQPKYLQNFSPTLRKQHSHTACNQNKSKGYFCRITLDFT